MPNAREEADYTRANTPHQPIRRLRTLIWERHSFFYCDSPIRTPDSGFRVCSISPPEIGENMSTLSSTFQPECARSPVC